MIEQTIFQGSTDFDAIINTMKRLFVCSYGRISKVVNEKEIIVTETASDTGVVYSYRATYVSFSSFCFESSVKPNVNDFVLILSPRIWSKDLFDAKEITDQRSVKGYSKGCAIAIGISTIKNNSITRIAVTEDTLSVTIGAATVTDNDEEEKHVTNVSFSSSGNVTATIGDEDNASSLELSVIGPHTINIGNDDNESDSTVSVTGNSSEAVKKDKTIEADGKVVINSGDSIELNGSSNNLVKWTELNQALSEFVMKLQISLTTTPIAGQGAPVPSWVNFPTSIDISKAKCDTLKTD